MTTVHIHTTERTTSFEWDPADGDAQSHIDEFLRHDVEWLHITAAGGRQMAFLRRSITGYEVDPTPVVTPAPATPDTPAPETPAPTP